jgi:hypothetical protein
MEHNKKVAVWRVIAAAAIVGTVLIGGFGCGTTSPPPAKAHIDFDPSTPEGRVKLQQIAIQNRRASLTQSPAASSAPAGGGQIH